MVLVTVGLLVAEVLLVEGSSRVVDATLIAEELLVGTSGMMDETFMRIGGRC
jgi:hypothetical protein